VIRSPAATVWDELVGQLIVLDMASPWVYVGKLVAADGDFLVLEGVDAHDLRDTSTTREKYVLDCRQHGISENRRRAWVNLREVVGVSRLEDVFLP
jgi:hypothetical protein